MSGYIYNFNVFIKYIKNVLNKNILGKIRYIYFERCNLGPIRNDTSCIWDLASHDISTASYLLKGEPKIRNVQVYKSHRKEMMHVIHILKFLQ